MEVELEAVGRRIGALRAAEGWRLADLASATGYTTSYLSQIERGTAVPSLSAVAALASALGVEMIHLFEDTISPRVTITRAGEGDRLTRSNGSSFRLISRTSAERSYTVLIQGADYGSILHRHFGERFLVVLQGTARVQFTDEQFELGPADTLHYSATEHHTFESVGGESVELLVVSRPALI